MKANLGTRRHNEWFYKLCVKPADIEYLKMKGPGPLKANATAVHICELGELLWPV